MHTHRVPRACHPRHRDSIGVVPDDVISTGHEYRVGIHHLRNACFVHLHAAKYNRRYITNTVKCVLVFPTVPTDHTYRCVHSPLSHKKNPTAVLYGSRGRGCTCVLEVKEKSSRSHPVQQRSERVMRDTTQPTTKHIIDCLLCSSRSKPTPTNRRTS